MQLLASTLGVLVLFLVVYGLASVLAAAAGRLIDRLAGESDVERRRE